MKIQLIDNWKATLKNAWSVKFMILSIICEVLERTLQPAQNNAGIWGTLSNVSIVAGVFARFLAQKEMSK